MWQGELYIIDVSQSVDLDHPRALHFLREDIQHVNAFFHRAGVPTLTMRELFDFVLNASVTPDSLDAEVQRLMDLAARCGCGAAWTLTNQQQQQCAPGSQVPMVYLCLRPFVMSAKS